MRKNEAESVIVLPNWKRHIQDQLLNEIIVKEVVSGQAEEILEKGKTMIDLNLQFRPGKIKAIRLISTLNSKDPLSVGPKTQDLIMTSLTA
ncbi:MAG: hypothetical protein EZS28_025789 [Streblomastix strix]|uniref:Uncharacterized protein n=1 Tax=Streblomastix strix TaxID=222440 RepID=A0A5J4V786_9EUKA|nr:MAG: hypothetical protein EZS28_025789 [Streblomastix strix]